MNSKLTNRPKTSPNLQFSFIKKFTARLIYNDLHHAACLRKETKYCPLCQGNFDGFVRLSEPTIGPPPRECSLCLENTITSEDQGVSGNDIFCSHVYHERCIVNWLNRGHNCCPLCKYENGNKKTPLELSKSMRERFPLGRELKTSDKFCVIL